MNVPRKLPPASMLRELLRYIPSTGQLFWRKPPRRWRKPTLEAGCRDRKYYVLIVIDGLRFSAHRIIWKMVTGRDPRNQIDHKNGFTQDNRWKNLRQATARQNARNRRARYPFKGTTKIIGRKTFIATIRLPTGKTKTFGPFKTPKRAHLAYIEAAKKLHGEFFRAP